MNTEQMMRAALQECEAYFCDRADADCDQDGFIPNKEMSLLVEIRAALAADARLAASDQEIVDALSAIVTWAEDLGYFADQGAILAPVFQRGRSALAKVRS